MIITELSSTSLSAGPAHVEAAPERPSEWGLLADGVEEALASNNYVMHTHPLIEPDDLNNSIGNPSFLYLFTGPYHFITGILEILPAIATLDRYALERAVTKVVQHLLGFGSAFTQTLDIALIMGIITNVSLTAVLPATTVLGVLFMLVQLAYEMRELKLSHSFYRALDHDLYKELKGLVNKDDLTDTEANAFIARFEKKLSKLVNLDGVKRAVSQAYDTDSPREALTTIMEDLQALFLEAQLKRIKNKYGGISPAQSKKILKKHKDRIDNLTTDTAARKAYSRTFETISDVRKGNALTLARRVRPWMAREFFNRINNIEAGFNSGDDLYTFAKADDVYENLFLQAKKMRTFHIMSTILLTVTTILVGISALKLPVAATVILSVLQTASFLLRNAIVFGYLDEQGNDFSWKHTLPNWFKEYYARFFDGPIEPFAVKTTQPIRAELREELRMGRLRAGIIENNGYGVKYEPLEYKISRQQTQRYND